jgi:hypothetical protein
MPALKASEQRQPRCYEHHVEMRIVEAFVESIGLPARASAYAYPQPDCGVHTPQELHRLFPALNAHVKSQPNSKFPFLQTLTVDHPRWQLQVFRGCVQTHKFPARPN